MKTNKTALEPENKTQIERVILLAYFLHTLFVSVAVIALRWDFWLLVPLIGGMAASIYLYVGEVQTYAFRACFTSAMLWINLVIYGLYTDSFTGMLTSIGTIFVLLALYGLPSVFRIGNIFYTALVIYHLFYLHDLGFTPDKKGMQVIVRIVAVYLIEAVAYYLIRVQNESRLRLLSNIESLKKAERSKDDFMANVSHEIRTPVNTICGMSEIVLQGELSEEARTYMYGVQTAGRNLLSIVSDILDFSELQSGKTEIQQEAYSVTSLVNDIINSANAKNSEKGLEFVVDADAGMPTTLIGDRQKISRAVLNVIDNAVKFTEEGGVVLTFRSRKEEYGANLCISVKDTGIGIRPEVLEKIFTSFNQADTKRNRTEGGIGLGLAISRAIVTKMGGFLNVRSTPGEGTQVLIVIPQKVENETPCVGVNNPEIIHILVYLHLDKYKYPLIREGYQNGIETMLRRLDISAHLCRNLSEVKRRMENENVTHLFVGWDEYQEDAAYFEQAAQKRTVTLVLDRKYQEEPKHTRMLCIYMPFYCLSVASILNGETVRDISESVHRNRFTAPDAHVLIVDDNRMNLKVAEGLLRPYQIQLTEAQSGKEALKLIENRCYDFVFMDHMMPEMDGVEAFHRIREKGDSYCKTVPVIALTANAVGNAREMFLAEGFADYISKPIEMSAMEHILRKFIPVEKIVYVGRELNPPKVAPPAESTAGETSAKAQLTSRGSLQDASQLPGIDTRKGIAYCGGSLEDYLEILRMYYENGRENIPKIREACASGDWKGFVILAHTVKGTSKSIGAADLSELALDLEKSGKEGNLADIEARTRRMLEKYEQVLKTIADSSLVYPDGAPGERENDGQQDAVQPDNGVSVSACDAADADTGEIQAEQTKEAAGTRTLSEEAFGEACEELHGLLNSFDSDAAAEFLERQKGRVYQGEDLYALYGPVRKKVNDFDFLGAQEELEKLQKEGNRK